MALQWFIGVVQFHLQKLENFVICINLHCSNTCSNMCIKLILSILGRIEKSSGDVLTFFCICQRSHQTQLGKLTRFKYKYKIKSSCTSSYTLHLTVCE